VFVDKITIHGKIVPKEMLLNAKELITGAVEEAGRNSVEKAVEEFVLPVKPKVDFRLPYSRSIVPVFLNNKLFRLIRL